MGVKKTSQGKIKRDLNPKYSRQVLRALMATQS